MVCEGAASFGVVPRCYAGAATRGPLCPCWLALRLRVDGFPTKGSTTRRRRVAARCRVGAALVT